MTLVFLKETDLEVMISDQWNFLSCLLNHLQRLMGFKLLSVTMRTTIYILTKLKSSELHRVQSQNTLLCWYIFPKVLFPQLFDAFHLSISTHQAKHYQGYVCCTLKKNYNFHERFGCFKLFLVLFRYFAKEQHKTLSFSMRPLLGLNYTHYSCS